MRLERWCREETVYSNSQMSECNIFGLKQSLSNIDRLTCCYYGGQRVRKACCHSARRKKSPNIHWGTYECIIPSGYLQICWTFACSSSINKPFKVTCLYKSVLLVLGRVEQTNPGIIFPLLTEASMNNHDWRQSFQHWSMEFLKWCLKGLYVENCLNIFQIFFYTKEMWCSYAFLKASLLYSMECKINAYNARNNAEISILTVLLWVVQRKGINPNNRFTMFETV